jgi:hypothetical protein
LTPEWEKLAKATKGYVKVAYWDTEESGRPPPRLLGEYKGTPTIRLFVPKPKQNTPDSYAKKNVLDYQYERKAIDIKKFVEGNMPNFLESIKGISDLLKFQEKAHKYGLPRVLIFTSKAQTLPLTKYLSTEFRRKLLIAEIHPTKLNQEVIAKLGITKFPTVIVYPVGKSSSAAFDDDEPVWYDGEGFSRHKLQSFLSKHALKEKVLPPPKQQHEPTKVEKEPAAKAAAGATDSPPQESTAEEKPVRVGADGEL